MCVFQDPHLSVSLSGSQEGLGNDTKSDNWGDLNGNVNVNGNGLSGNSEFSPSISSPKRIKNKSCKTKDFVLIKLSSKLYCLLTCSVFLLICVFGSVGEQYLSRSNYMDSISMSGSNGCSLSSSLKGTDLPELFSKLGLGKYTDIFQQQEVILDLHLQKEIPMFAMQKKKKGIIFICIITQTILIFILICFKNTCLNVNYTLCLFSETV